MGRARRVRGPDVDKQVWQGKDESSKVRATRTALVVSAGDPRAIRGPGLLVKRGLIGRSRSSREGKSGCERKGKCEGKMRRRGSSVHGCDTETNKLVVRVVCGSRVDRDIGDFEVAAVVETT